MRRLKTGCEQHARRVPRLRHLEYTRLSHDRRQFNRTAAIKLDAAQLKAAVLDDANAVRTLFVGATGTGGVFGALKAQVERLHQGRRTGAGREGSPEEPDRQDRLAAGHDGNAARASAPVTLQREFIAADRLMSQLNGQGSSLQALGGQYRLF